MHSCINSGIILIENSAPSAVAPSLRRERQKLYIPVYTFKLSVVSTFDATESNILVIDWRHNHTIGIPFLLKPQSSIELTI